MTSISTKPDSFQLEAETAPHLFDNWFDPIESEVRGRARQFIEELIHAASSTRYWSALVMGEARRPAVKKARALLGIATAAGRGR